MPLHKESRMQQACVQWFRMQYPELAINLFAVPNGVATSATQGRILKAEGMVAGVADLILMYPNADHHGLCIEMKTKEGTQRPTQKAWQQAVERYGYRYVVVRDIDTFISTIQNYIGK